jgi:hypothetical protein
VEKQRLRPTIRTFSDEVALTESQALRVPNRVPIAARSVHFLSLGALA